MPLCELLVKITTASNVYEINNAVRYTIPYLPYKAITVLETLWLFKNHSVWAMVDVLIGKAHKGTLYVLRFN